jgi:hypothetical protein
MDMSALAKVPWYELSPADIASTQAAINDHEENILRIDAQANELVLQINSLRASRQSHLNSQKLARGLLSPLRRVPTDVLADIIQHCVTAGWWKAPLVLSRLSSAWFQASRTPRVWSTLYVNADEEDVLLRTHFWLKRAKTCALNVTLRASPQEHNLAAVMRALSPVAGQIWHLVVDSASLDELELVLSHCPPKMEALESLEVAVEEDALAEADQTISLDQFRNAFQHSGRLHTLIISCNSLTPFVSFPSTIQTLNLNLKSVTIDMIACVQMLSNVILPSLPLLADFAFDITALQYEDNWSHRSNELPISTVDNLRKLRLHASPFFTVLLDKLSCPNLDTLTLSSPASASSPHEPTGHFLEAFLDRSRPPLRTLTLHDIDIPNPAFVHCFDLLPALEDLRLHWSDISVDTLQRLVDGACPRLKRLDLRWCSHLEGGVLVDLVRRRMDGASTHVQTHADAPSIIEEIAVLNCPIVEEGDVLELASMTVCRVTLRPQGDPCRTYRLEPPR